MRKEVNNCPECGSKNINPGEYWYKYPSDGFYEWQKHLDNLCDFENEVIRKSTMEH